MNREKLSKMMGKRVRLRPIPRRIDQDGTELPPVDDTWFVDEASRTALTLENQRTVPPHVLRLGTDHVREYQTDLGRTDGVLVLKSQVIMTRSRVIVEPLAALAKG